MARSTVRTAAIPEFLTDWGKLLGGKKATKKAAAKPKTKSVRKKKTAKSKKK